MAAKSGYINTESRVTFIQSVDWNSMTAMGDWPTTFSV